MRLRSDISAQVDVIAELAACEARRDAAPSAAVPLLIIESSQVIRLTEQMRRAYVLKIKFGFSNEQAARRMQPPIARQSYDRLLQQARAAVGVLKDMALAVGGDPAMVDQYLQANIIEAGAEPMLSAVA